MLICNKEYTKEGLSQYQTTDYGWMHSFFMQLSNKFDKAEILFGQVNFLFCCNILDMQMLRRIQPGTEVQTVPSLLHAQERTLKC